MEYQTVLRIFYQINSFPCEPRSSSEDVRKRDRFQVTSCPLRDDRSYGIPTLFLRSFRIPSAFQRLKEVRGIFPRGSFR